MNSTSRVRLAMLRVGAFGLAAALAAGGLSAAALHENADLPAAIHAGTCETPGDVVLEVGNLVRLP